MITEYLLHHHQGYSIVKCIIVCARNMCKDNEVSHSVYATTVTFKWSILQSS